MSLVHGFVKHPVPPPNMIFKEPNVEEEMGLLDGEPVVLQTMKHIPTTVALRHCPTIPLSESNYAFGFEKLKNKEGGQEKEEKEDEEDEGRMENFIKHQAEAFKRLNLGERFKHLEETPPAGDKITFSRKPTVEVDRTTNHVTIKMLSFGSNQTYNFQPVNTVVLGLKKKAIDSFFDPPKRCRSDNLFNKFYVEYHEKYVGGAPPAEVSKGSSSQTSNVGARVPDDGGDAAKKADTRIVKRKKAEVTKKEDTHVVKRKKAEVTKKADTHVVKPKKAEVTKKVDTHAVKPKKDDAPKKADTRFVIQKKVNGTKKADTHFVIPTKGDATKKADIHAVKRKMGEATEKADTHVVKPKQVDGTKKAETHFVIPKKGDSTKKVDIHFVIPKKGDGTKKVFTHFVIPKKGGGTNKNDTHVVKRKMGDGMEKADTHVVKQKKAEDEDDGTEKADTYVVKQKKAEDEDDGTEKADTHVIPKKGDEDEVRNTSSTSSRRPMTFEEEDDDDDDVLDLLADGGLDDLMGGLDDFEIKNPTRVRTFQGNGGGSGGSRRW